MNINEFLSMTLISGGLFALFLLMPWGRQGALNVINHARTLYIELPLRAITGRRRPSQTVIERLERELIDQGKGA